MTNIAIENGTFIVDLPISLWLWYLYWLVVILPLWKIWVRQLGWWNSMKIPTEWTNKIHVPNHQPNNYLEPVACQLQTLQLIIFLVKIPPFISKHDLLQVGFPTFLVKKQSILDFLGNKLPSKSSNSKKKLHPTSMKPFMVDFHHETMTTAGFFCRLSTSQTVRCWWTSRWPWCASLSPRPRVDPCRVEHGILWCPVSWENYCCVPSYNIYIYIYIYLICIYRNIYIYIYWLVVYLPELPLWKMMEWKSVGILTFPIYGKIKTCSTPPTSVYYIYNYIKCGAPQL